MVRFIVAAGAIAIATCGASAEARYDRKIDQAAAAIVAGKIGEIRGGFEFDQMPEFVRPVDWRRSRWNALDIPPVETVGASVGPMQPS